MKKEYTENDTAQKISRILVVDDHKIVRQSLARLINHEKNLEVVAQAENATKALDILNDIEVDLAIVDISMKGESGLELTEKIKNKFSDLKVLILSMHDELMYAEFAFAAGADGYLTKQNAPKKVIIAIEDVIQGNLYICDTFITKFKKAPRFMHRNSVLGDIIKLTHQV